MLTYLFKRLLEMIPTLVGITLISFFIIHLAPGKPTDVLADLNPKMTPEARERLEKYYGLDKPIHIQYGMWLKRIVKLDFGDSFSTDRRPVWTKIKERLPITILINSLALVLIFVIAIPIGVSSAVRPYSLFYKINTGFLFFGFFLPPFLLFLFLF